MYSVCWILFLMYEANVNLEVVSRCFFFDMFYWKIKCLFLGYFLSGSFYCLFFKSYVGLLWLDVWDFLKLVNYGGYLVYLFGLYFFLKAAFYYFYIRVIMLFPKKNKKL